MEITVTIDNGVVKLKHGGKILMSGSATKREAIAISLLHAIICAHSDSEFNLTRLFTKDEFDKHKGEADLVMLRCRWTKNGYLKRVGETEDQFKHANTVKDALLRVGAFTCTVGTFKRIPKSKCIKKPKVISSPSTLLTTTSRYNESAPGASM